MLIFLYVPLFVEKNTTAESSDSLMTLLLHPREGGLSYFQAGPTIISWRHYPGRDDDFLRLTQGPDVFLLLIYEDYHALLVPHLPQHLSWLVLPGPGAVGSTSYTNSLPSLATRTCFPKVMTAVSNSSMAVTTSTETDIRLVHQQPAHTVTPP